MYSGAMRSARSAFLLAQLGSLSAARFGERTEALGLTPAEAGILRQLAHRPSISQRQLADDVGLAASRLVALIDSLVERQLVARERSARDRRNYELTLTTAGEALFRRLREVSEAHERELLSPLSAADRERLTAILEELAAAHGLSREVHRAS